MIAIDLIVLVPLALALVAIASGRLASGLPRWVSLLAALAQAVLVGLVAASADGGRVTSMLSGQGTAWSLVVDGLSLPLLALTAFVGVVAALASWRVDDRPGAHHGLLIVLQAAVALVFLADDLLLFYIAWESALVPMYLLIGGWGSSNARKAAMKFLVYTFAGGAVLLVGVIFAIVAGGTSSIGVLASAGSKLPAQTLLFWLLAIGMLVKVPAVPLHTWLPDAHTEAPTAGSIILAGVLLKMGGYGLLRVALPLAPAGFESARVVLAALGLIGVVWGAATALVQSDLKRLVAYSSIAHMGFVLLAVAVDTKASLSAALLTMVSHGLVAGMLFFLVGALYERTHTRDLQRFGGLGAVVPKWGVAFVFASLASAGLPGLSGFPGEFVTAVESWKAYGWWTLVLGVGVALAAAYNLRAVRETVQGPTAEFTDIKDLDRREALGALLFAAGIVVLGLAPWLITSGADSVLSVIAKSGGM